MKCGVGHPTDATSFYNMLWRALSVVCTKRVFLQFTGPFPDSKSSEMTGLEITRVVDRLSVILGSFDAVVVYGSHQSIEHSLIAIAGLTGRINIVPLPSYLDFRINLREVEMHWSNLAVAVPIIWKNHACTIDTVVPIFDISDATCMCNCANIRPTSSTVPRRTIFVRQDVHGKVQMHRTEPHTWKPYNYDIHPLLLAPFSSPDMITMLASNIINGVATKIIATGLYQRTGPLLVVNPAHMRWLSEDSALYHKYIRPMHTFWTRCLIGGGSVRHIFKTNTTYWPCAKTLAVWGSIERGFIGFTLDGIIYKLAPYANKSVVDYGPYSNPYGVLKFQGPYKSLPLTQIGDNYNLQTHNIVKRTADDSVEIVDKTGRGSQLCRLGIIEMLLENRYTTIKQAALYATEIDAHIQIDAVLRSTKNRDYSRAVQDAVQHVGHCLKPYRMGTIAYANESWEKRPRLKIYTWVHESFLNRSKLVENNRKRLSEYIVRAKRAFITTISTLQCANQIVDALFGCDGIHCVQWGENGLREPERSLRPFDEFDRTERFDHEPWNLWKINMLPCEFGLIMDLLYARPDILELVPQVWPHLGTLQSVGIRMRARIHCAHKLAKDNVLIHSPLSHSLIRRVLALCRNWN